MKYGQHVKLLLFDLDGTLADSLSVLRQAYETFCRRHNILVSDEEFSLLNGPPLKEIVDILRVQFHLQSSSDALLREYNSIIDELYVSVKVTSGSLHLIKSAVGRGCELGVVTSNTHARSVDWLTGVDLMPYFKFVVSSDTCTRGKPDPEPYQHALMLGQVENDCAIAVEDSITGATAALAANVKTFLLSKGKVPIADSRIVQVISMMELNEILFGLPT